MATLNAISRPRSFVSTTAEHVATVAGDAAASTIDAPHKVSDASSCSVQIDCATACCCDNSDIFLP